MSRDDGPALAVLPRDTSASQDKYIRFADILISNGANVNCYGGRLHSPLQAAACQGVKELVSLYIHHGAVVDAIGGSFQTALNAAIQFNRQDIAKMLLEAGASPTLELDGGLTTLCRAVAKSADYVVEVLISTRPELISQQTIQDALRVAAQNDKLDTFKVLLAKAASVEEVLSAPRILFDAIGAKGNSVLDYLLDKGKNLINLVEKNDLYGTTPLAYAAAGGHDCVDELLEAGADPNITDDRGNTPVTLAVKANGEYSVDNLLFKRRKADQVARLDIVDFAGRGALYWACYFGYDRLFYIIMECLKKRNAKAADYSSAVHAASAKNMANILERLFAMGADPTQLDRNNWTPLDTATEYNATEILPLLLKFKGQDPQPQTLELKRPTSWNTMDVHKQVEVSDQGLRMKLKGPVDAAMGRSDFCMPTNIPLYYFEVTIEKLVPRDGNTKPLELGVGFCEEHAALDRMVGLYYRSWGYHSDDGALYSKNGQRQSNPSYVVGYAEGDTIGCGIDFSDRTAFFTKNGVFLGVGKAFDNIRGKLYPAVSFGRNLAMDSCILANFGGNPAMKFKYSPPVGLSDGTELDLDPNLA
ncbi:hypothetical protein ONZ43_g4937 [Nemania bipapillata]|uniref:Uncharacterized protein n=1 Tax=Nemania bipapillata TaxID=110536 RepID=A0ACC2IGM1_9PEZI|nr:hypothetical protein ONZ43_g4937 [Nemania bipapillata]